MIETFPYKLQPKQSQSIDEDYRTLKLEVSNLLQSSSALYVYMCQMLHANAYSHWTPIFKSYRCGPINRTVTVPPNSHISHSMSVIALLWHSVRKTASKLSKIGVQINLIKSDRKNRFYQQKYISSFKKSKGLKMKEVVLFQKEC